MRLQDLETMLLEDLWNFYEELTGILRKKIAEEKLELERRLALLSRSRGKYAKLEFLNAPKEADPAPSKSAKSAPTRRKYRNSAALRETPAARSRDG